MVICGGDALTFSFAFSTASASTTTARGVLRWLGTARGLFGGAFTLADVILARVPRVSGGFEHCRPTLEDLFPCLTLCVLGIGVII